MKPIRSGAELLKKLQKHSLLFGIDRYYLSDRHKTPVARSIAEKFLNDGIMESTVGLKSWFESEWRLKWEEKQKHKAVKPRKATVKEMNKILSK